ncbi:hypothetical protein I9W82_005298 [Candida metapsilosis]|uniref:Uncharacterized protein n=1 Tax=Candida metapsilosis TaxID=273372 RepID=A0A8H7ZFE4_9ASCO|nr:hypothetical protein I9W82_005298 [Candida metapsilosis]
MSLKLPQSKSMSPTEPYDPLKYWRTERRKRIERAEEAERADRLRNLAPNTNATTPNVYSTGLVSAFTNTANHQPTSNDIQITTTSPIQNEKADPTNSAKCPDFDVQFERDRGGFKLCQEKRVEDARGNSGVGFKRSLRTNHRPDWKDECDARKDMLYATKGLLEREANGHHNPYRRPNELTAASPIEKTVLAPIPEITNSFTDQIEPLAVNTEVEQPVMSPQVEERGYGQQAVATAEQKKVGVAKWKNLFRRKKLNSEFTTGPGLPDASELNNRPVQKAKPCPSFNPYLAPPVVPSVPVSPVVLPSRPILVVKSEKWQIKSTIQKWLGFSKKNPAGLTCLEQASAKDSRTLRQKERRKEYKRKRKAAKKLKSSKPAYGTVSDNYVTYSAAAATAATAAATAAGNSENDTDLNPNGANLKPTEHEAVGSDSNLALNPCVGWNPYTDTRPSGDAGSTSTEYEDDSGGSSVTAAAGTAAAVKLGPDKPVRKWNLFKRFFTWIKSKSKDTGATTPSDTDSDTDTDTHTDTDSVQNQPTSYWVFDNGGIYKRSH